MSITKKPAFKGQRFTTQMGRLSFPALFKPKLKYQSQTDYEYTAELLFDKNTDHSDFKKRCDLAVAEVYGNDKKKWPPNISFPLADQEILIEKAGDRNTDHLTPGAMYARFKTNAKNGKPLVVDQQMAEIIDETVVYGGCYVRVSGTLKVNTIKGTDPVTKRPVLSVYVTPYLSGVQFIKDGDRFGGRPSASEMFEPVAFDGDLASSGEEDLVG